MRKESKRNKNQKDPPKSKHISYETLRDRKKFYASKRKVREK